MHTDLFRRGLSNNKLTSLRSDVFGHMQWMPNLYVRTYVCMRLELGIDTNWVGAK